MHNTTIAITNSSFLIIRAGPVGVIRARQNRKCLQIWDRGGCRYACSSCGSGCINFEQVTPLDTI